MYTTMKHSSVLCSLAALLASAPLASAVNLLVNGDFETPLINTANTVGQDLNGDLTGDVTAVYIANQIVGIQDNSILQGWTTNDPLGFEVWGYGALGFSAASGNQWIELNHTTASTQTQILPNTFGVGVGTLSLSHQGRAGVDVMQAEIFDLGLNGVFGGGDDVSLFVNSSITDGNTGWGNYSFGGIGINNANNLGIALSAISSSGGSLGVGNFIDNIGFEVVTVPEPTSLLLGGVAALGMLRRRRC